MLRPKKLGRLALFILACGLTTFSSFTLTGSVSAQSVYATPSIESIGDRGECITDQRDYLQANNTVLESKCDGDYGQYWQYLPGRLEIAFQHDHSECLVPFGRSAKNNTPVILAPCRGEGIYWDQYNGGYRNRLSHLCLQSNGSGDILRQAKCTDSNKQKWQDPGFIINTRLCGNNVTANPVQARCIALDLMQIYPYYWNPYQPVTLTSGETANQWTCLNDTWYAESRWQRIDGNTYSAYGIPQADPGKTNYVGVYKDALPPDNSAIVQIRWGLSYINGRYTYPCAAWEHEEKYHWYVVNTQST